MKTDGRNLPASVAARLLAKARQRGDDYQVLLTSFCFERFLHRLGESPVKDRFVLKGARLLQVWSDRPYRATSDLDLLYRGDRTPAKIRDDIESVCSVPVEPDGVSFASGSIRIETIRAAVEEAGVRVTLPAQSGTARLRLQIDLGFGDAAWPPPTNCVYAAMLEFPPPEILAYSPEAVVAEKLEAMVVLGDRNSRIKDFFDLHYLAGRFEFERRTLAGAARRTFARRGTPIPVEEPIGLTQAYWRNPSRPAQVESFTRRAHLALGRKGGEELLPVLRDFLLPVIDDLRRGSAAVEGRWPRGGPWQ